MFYGKPLSYKQLNQRVNQFARGLATLGIGAGDRVMIVLPNTPQFVIAYYAILKLRAVVVLSNPDANAELIAAHARDTEAKAFITLNAFSELAELIRDTTETQNLIFTRIGQHVTTSAASAFGRHKHPTPADNELAERIGVFMSRPHARPG